MLLRLRVELLEESTDDQWKRKSGERRERFPCNQVITCHKIKRDKELFNG